MYLRRVISAAAPLVVASALTALPAWAAAPTNDTSSGAIALTPYVSGFQETGEATTDAEDAQLNAFCGFASTENSVWYTTVGTGNPFSFNVEQSDYSAGVIVATGSPGNLEAIACGEPGLGLGWPTEAGTTYYLLVVDPSPLPGRLSHQVLYTLAEIFPEPTVHFTVNPTGTVQARTGVARISGTFTCTDAGFASIFGSLTQKVGRGTVFGIFDFTSDNECDGAAHSWSAVVDQGEIDKFAGGKARVFSEDILACGDGGCAIDHLDRVIRLRGTTSG